MIIHKVLRSKGEITNTKKCISYITREFGKNIKQENIFCVNCNENSQIACYEILDTQAKNTRTKSDKTNHYIVSFKQGELPPMETIKNIEADIMNEIGYANHQRVCALHTDETDNVHLHIVVNKICPTPTKHGNYTIHEQKGDIDILLKKSDKWEKKYNLGHDNHGKKHDKNRLSNSASKIEYQAGVESFEGYIKRNCFDAIQNAQTWNELHSALAEHNIKLEKKGGGLAFTNLDDNLQVKASNISREFSLKSLEKRLGEFQPAPNTNKNQKKGEKFDENQKNKKSYKEKPIKTKKTSDSKELFAQYSAEKTARQLNNTQRTIAINMAISLRESQKEHIQTEKEQIQKSFQSNIGLARFVQDPALKMLLIWLAKQERKEKMRQLYKEQAQYSQTTIPYVKQKTWVTWLQEKAEQGNEKALNVLKARENNGIINGNYLKIVGINPQEQLQNFQNNFEKFHISKHGTLIVPMGKTNLRTDGEKIQLGFNSTIGNWQKVLKTLPNKKIEIHGNAYFITKIVRTCAKQKLPIVFANENLNQYKNRLERKYDEQRNRESARESAGKSTGKSAGTRNKSTRRNANANGGAFRGNREPTTANRNFNNGSNSSFRARANARNDGKSYSIHGTNNHASSYNSTNNRQLQPNITQFGEAPPPKFRNSLRTLSQCDMVSFADRSEMLLSPTIYDNVVNKNTESNNALRWEIQSGSRTSSTSNIKEQGEKQALQPPQFQQSQQPIKTQSQLTPNNEILAKSTSDINKPSQKKESFPFFTQQELESAREYITERNEKRKQGMTDIPLHDLFDNTFGEYKYKGVRQKNNDNFILLEKDERIKLLPITNEIYGELKNKRGIKDTTFNVNLADNNKINIQFSTSEIEKNLQKEKVYSKTPTKPKRK